MNGSGLCNVDSPFTCGTVSSVYYWCSMLFLPYRSCTGLATATVDLSIVQDAKHIHDTQHTTYTDQHFVSCNHFCCHMMSGIGITAFHPATFWSYSVFRTVQHGSFSRRQGDLTPSHYYASCTGCRFNVESCTSWRYWCTRSGPHWCQRIWVVTSSYVTACGRYAWPWPLDCPNLSLVQHLPSEHSAVLLRPSGTLCQEQSLTATR